jgi:hypothetical protein
MPHPLFSRSSNIGLGFVAASQISETSRLARMLRGNATSLRPSFAVGFGRALQGYGTAGKIAPLLSIAAEPRQVMK